MICKILTIHIALVLKVGSGMTFKKVQCNSSL